MRAASVRVNAKPNSHRKTHQVESGGVCRKFQFLPGEISWPDGREKSAEAIVVMKRL